MKLTIYECDVTGERFGAKNDILVYDTRYVTSNDDPTDYIESTLCIALEAIPDGIQLWLSDIDTEYIVIGRGEKPTDKVILGAQMMMRSGAREWRNRDELTVSEQFLKFIEEEANL